MTCTSMGAGSGPEIRTLVRDIGPFSKGLQSSGNFSCSRLRSCSDSDRGRRMLLGQEMRISPSLAAPITALSPNPGLDPPGGTCTNIVENHRIQFPRRNHSPDFLLDFREDQFCLLNARSGRRLRVQSNLAGIHGWEEIPSHQVDQPQGAQGKNQEGGENRGAMVERPIQQSRVLQPSSSNDRLGNAKWTRQMMEWFPALPASPCFSGSIHFHFQLLP